MNFSVEIWKRSFQRFGSSSRQNVENQEVREEEEAFDQKMRVLETRLTHKEAQVLRLEEKLASLEKKFEQKEEKLSALIKESNEKDRLIVELGNAANQQKTDWLKKEEFFVAEMQEFASLLEDKCAALNCATVEARIEKERCNAMEASLKEKLEDLRCCREAHAESHLALISCQDELKTFQGALYQLQSRFPEKAENLQSVLRGKNTDLESTMRNLDESISRLLDKAHRSDVETQDLRQKLEVTEFSLSSSREEIMDLQLKVELGNRVAAELAGAKAKIKELEDVLRKVVECAQEKDAKLDASEWAVQQLGVHDVQLKHRMAHLERKLKSKEEELIDMESYAGSLRQELRKMEFESEAMKKDLQAAGAKHDRLSAKHEAALKSIDDYASRLKTEEAKNFMLEEQINQLNSSALISQQDAGLANVKLKELLTELERTQASNTDLMDQMLLLHDDLLHDNTGMEIMAIDEHSALEQIERDAPDNPSVILRKSSSQHFNEKENQIESKSSCKRSRNFEAKEHAGFEGPPVPGERAPLKAVQLSKRQRQ